MIELTFALGCVAGALGALVLTCMTLLCGCGKCLMWTPMTDATALLGDPSYRVKQLPTPAASGFALKIFAAIGGGTGILSQNLRRLLLNGNEMSSIRALSYQIMREGRTPVVHYPMLRLDDKGLAKHQRLASEAERPRKQRGPYNSVLDYHAAFQSGASSPVKVLENIFEAVDSLPSELRVFREMVGRDALRREAQASTDRYATGKFLSVFDGVPVAFKDMVFMSGINCTRGTDPSWGTGLEKKDDVTIARLREVGAVVLGLTVMTEFGTTPLGYSPHAQAPVNAYDPSRYPGGSSSGCGIGAALGLFPVALGFDGGGSVRIPASMSGIVGLKCSWGRIAVDDDYCAANVASGPMAGSAVDAALFYEVIGKPVADHFYSKLYGATSLPPAHCFNFNRVDDLSDLRLGVYQPWFDDCHPEVRAKSSEALNFLQLRGAKVVPIQIPNLEVLALAHGVSISVEFAAVHDKQLWDAPKTLEPATHVQLALGASMTGNEYHSTQWIRGWAIDYFEELFRSQELSGIFTPTIGTLPPVMPPAARATGESNTTLVLSLLQYIFVANLCGLPAVSMPAGVSTEGLPIGVHLMGKQWDEHVCLRVANAMDMPQFRTTPPKFVNLLS